MFAGEHKPIIGFFRKCRLFCIISLVNKYYVPEFSPLCQSSQEALKPIVPCFILLTLSWNLLLKWFFQQFQDIIDQLHDRISSDVL